ncbi:hypothetical protein N7G274_002908 [Stereocaulon virgatum]|uniref:Uncharacterized protein n=1 Tax=Stereocaulon virgatum TaxID=373712 RepID=A0ABR4AEK6_9LECA
MLTFEDHQIQPSSIPPPSEPPTTTTAMPLDTSTDTYNPPTSDADPYSSPTAYSISNPPPLPAHIDIATLPHALPFFGPLTGYTNSNLQHIIQNRYVYTSQAIGRSLSEKEMTALAYYTAKGHAIASYGPTIGLSAGLYRTWATRNEFRWPFYGKLLSEEAGTGFWDGAAMRVGGKEILQGVSTQAKTNILHVLRGMAYVSLGILFVPMMVSAYGATVSAVGEIKDERLHAVTEELRVVANKEMRDRRASMQERRGDPTGQGKKSAGEVWRERRERLEGKSSPKSLPDDDDDMSPTGGAMMDYSGIAEEQRRLSGAGEMGGVLSDTQMRTQEVRAQPEKKKSPTENRASAVQRERVSRQPKTFDDDYDDASPTGGRGAMDDGDASGGSVWERIRQQQASSGSSAPTQSRRRRGAMRQEQQEDSTAGDSFSFSSSEEERNYAKDEAQREFDERVEEERRGGDFGSGSEKRW